MAPASEQIKLHLARQFHLPEEQIELMLPNFITALVSHLHNLQKALESKDPVAIGKAGHTIKGAFLNLGLEDCAAIAKDIEQEGKAGNKAANFRELVQELAVKMQPVLAEVEIV